MMSDQPAEPVVSSASSPFASGDVHETRLSEAPLNPALYGIPVRVSVVLGQVTMPVQKLLELSRGSVLELNRKVGEAVDVYVNDRLVARGEVVIVDEHLGITLTEMVKTDISTL